MATAFDELIRKAGGTSTTGTANNAGQYQTSQLSSTGMNAFDSLINQRGAVGSTQYQQPGYYYGNTRFNTASQAALAADRASDPEYQYQAWLDKLDSAALKAKATYDSAVRTNKEAGRMTFDPMYAGYATDDVSAANMNTNTNYGKRISDEDLADMYKAWQKAEEEARQGHDVSNYWKTLTRFNNDADAAIRDYDRRIAAMEADPNLKREASVSGSGNRDVEALKAERDAFIQTNTQYKNAAEDYAAIMAWNKGNKGTVANYKTAKDAYDNAEAELQALYAARKAAGGPEVAAFGAGDSTPDSERFANDEEIQAAIRKRDQAKMIMDYAYANRFEDIKNLEDYDLTADKGEIAWQDFKENEQTQEMQYDEYGNPLGINEFDPYYRTNFADQNENWTEDEKKTFYYLFATNRDNAFAYGNEVNAKYAKAEAEENSWGTREWAQRDFGTGAVTSLLSIPAGLVGGLYDYMNMAAENQGAGGIYTTQYGGWSNWSEDVRGSIGTKLNQYGTLPEGIPVLGGKGLGDAYQLMMSMADSSVAVLAGGGITNLMFFGNAAASATRNALERGIEPDKAVAFGFANGAAEVLGEWISVDKLLSNDLDDYLRTGILKSMVIQGGVEGSEEFFTTLLNTAADYVINGDKNELQSKIDQYVAAGMSLDAAKKKAGAEWLEDICFDAVGGFLSGLGMAGGKIGLDVAKSSMTPYGGDFQTLQDLSELTDEGAKSRRLTSRYADEFEAWKAAYTAQSGSQTEQATQPAAGRSLEDQKAATAEGVQEGTQEQERVVEQKAEAVNDQQAQTQERTPKPRMPISEFRGRQIEAALREDLTAKDRAVLEEKTSARLEDLGVENPGKAASAVVDRVLGTDKGAVGNAISGLNFRDSRVRIVLQELTEQLAGETKGGSWLGNTELMTVGQNNAVTRTREARLRQVRVKGSADTVTIKNAGMQNGKLSFTYEQNGQDRTVTADQLDLDEYQRDAFDALVNTLGSDAAYAYNGMREAQRQGLSMWGVTQYATRFAMIRDLFGMKGAKLEAALASPLRQGLTDGQVEQAYKLGQQKANRIEDKRPDNMKGTGKVSMDGAVVDDRELKGIKNKKKVQKDARFRFLKEFAKALKIDIVLYESEGDSEGKISKDNPNGVYKDGVIYLDWNALRSAVNENASRWLMMFTLSHELTHFIEHNAKEEYKQLREFVTTYLAETQGKDFERMVEERMQPDEEGRAGMGYDEAVSEVVADACQTMLANSEYVGQLMNEKPSLWQKLQRWIRNFLKDLAGLPRELDIARAMMPAVEEMQRIWDAGLRAAVENRPTQIGDTDLADLSDAKGTDGKPLFQVRAFEHDEPQYRDMLKKWGGMTDTAIDGLFKTVNGAMKIIQSNLEALDYAWDVDIDDRGFSPVKPNSDKLYKVSQDFSTLCRKRILQGLVANQLQAALDRALTREEGIAIRDALIALQQEGRQIEVACALCYVESARMRSPAQIQKFLNDREKVIKEFFAGKDRGSTKERLLAAEAAERQAIYNEYGLVKGKGADNNMYDVRDMKTAKLKKLPGSLAQRIREAKKAAKAAYKPTPEQQRIIETANHMTVSDFTTPEGLERLAKNKDLRDIFDAYTSFIRNATNSKGIENDTWWRAGDSAKISDLLVEQMNRENGLRTQSWSDFQVKHLMDYIAATIELSTRNAKQHAYTKVIDYVDLMGNTGVMINMSLIPTREFRGTLEYDDVEGFVYREAMRLRDKYHATAGTICIGVDNRQIQMLLASDKIDYIIPYHHSGMAAHTRRAMHIPLWDDYQDFQNEKPVTGDAARANAKKYGVDLISADDPNWHVAPKFSDWFNLKIAQQEAKLGGKNGAYGIMTGGYIAMQNAAKRYAQICAERGLLPKFSYGRGDFSAEENYWKLLIDRKMVDNVTGDIIEQKAIKPIFEFETVERILNDELARYGRVKEDQNEAIRRVTEAFLGGKIKAGMSDKAIAAVMQKPVDNISMVNITQNAAQLSARGDVMDEQEEQDAVQEDFGSEGQPMQRGVQFSRRVTKDSTVELPDGRVVKTLDYLNDQLRNGEVVRTYKSFLEIVVDGKTYLLPPMASMQRDENGKLKMANAMAVGEWEESIGNPNSRNIIKKVNENGEVSWMYRLVKDNGDTVDAAYDPYQHSSDVVLNDQFEQAYLRPNLVTYECLIPKSELTSGYWYRQARSDGEVVEAALPVGKHDWKKGTVASSLTNTSRSVFLTRWLMPTRRLSNAEVAQKYKEILDKEEAEIKIPFNVVPPGLLKALEEAGVPIEYAGSPGYQYHDTMASLKTILKGRTEYAKIQEKIAKAELAVEKAKTPKAKASAETKLEAARGEMKALMRVETGNDILEDFDLVSRRIDKVPDKDLLKAAEEYDILDGVDVGTDKKGKPKLNKTSRAELENRLRTVLAEGKTPLQIDLTGSKKTAQFSSRAVNDYFNTGDLDVDTDRAYAAATALQDDLNDIVRGISAELGTKYESTTQKSKGSIKNKVLRKHQEGRTSYSVLDMKDHARSKVFVNNWDEIPRVLSYLRSQGIKYETEAIGPTPYGYRGFHVTWRSSDGLGSELQITMPHVWQVKLISDGIYDKWRNVKADSLVESEYKADLARSQKMWSDLQLPDFTRWDTSSADSTRPDISVPRNTGVVGSDHLPFTSSFTGNEESSNTRPSSVNTNIGAPPYQNSTDIISQGPENGKGIMDSRRTGDRSDVKTGLNFRDPSGALLERVFDRTKLYETRAYTDKQGNGRIPAAYLNKPMGIIQTGAGQAKRVGYWELGDGVLRDSEWLAEHADELGNDGTEFEAKPGEKKWVYPIKWAERAEEKPVTSKGIRARQIQNSARTGDKSDRELLLDASDASLTDAEQKARAAYRAQVDGYRSRQQAVVTLIDAMDKAVRDGDAAAATKLRAKLTEAEKRMAQALAGLTEAERGPELREILRREREIQRRRTDSRIRESYGRRELRQKVDRLWKDLTKRLSSPSEKKNIPANVMMQAVDVLEAINMDATRADSKAGQKLRDRLNELKSRYNALKNDPDFRQAAMYDAQVAEFLDNMIETVGDTPINRMSTEQLAAVYNTLKALDHVARGALKVRLRTMEYSAYDLSKRMTEETRSVGKQKAGAIDMYLNAGLSPARMFNRLGGYHKDSTWSQVYEMLNEGQLRQTQLQVEGSMLFEDLLAAKDYGKFVDPKNTVDVGLKDADGKTIEITHGMLVSLYMHLMNEQNRRHVAYGGLTIPGLSDYYNGKKIKGTENAKSAAGVLQEIAEINDRIRETDDPALKEALEAERDSAAEKAMSYLEELQKAVEGKLTEYDRKWIAACRELFDGFSKRALNEATMQVYGIKRANVENYFPIWVDGNFLNTPFESVAKDFSLENAGFMKERVDSAKPIRLADVSDVAASQIRKVAQYAGLMPVIHDFNKIWGKTQTGYRDSVRQAVMQTYGQSGVNYIENLMADLNGARGMENSPLGEMLNRLRGHMAQASLTLSLRTAMGQVASYPTAAAVLGWDAIRQGITNYRKVDPELILKWSPLLKYRMQGYRDPELGQIAQMNSKFDRAWKKARWATGWIQAFDGFTVGQLVWSASEAYVQIHDKSLQKGTDAYYEAVAKKFNEAVELTQPNYTTMQRPDILRNPNALVKQLTMFLTQRLQNFNIMYDAAATYSQMKKDRAAGKYGVTNEDVRQAGIRTRTAALSQITAAATIVAFKFLADVILHSMNAYRDDDDELTKESVSAELLDMFLDSLAGNVLGGGELYDLIESKAFGKTYYGIEVSGVSTVTDALKAVNDFYDAVAKGEVRWKDADKLAKKISVIAGIPYANAEKIIRGGIWHVQDMINGEFGSFEAGVDRTTGQQAHRLWRAYDAKDFAQAKKIRDEVGDDDKLNQALAAYIKKQYADGKINKFEAQRQLEKYAGKDKESAEKTMREYSSEVETGIKFSQIEDSFLLGDITAQKAQQMLVKYGGLDAQTAKMKVDFWSYQNKNPGSKLEFSSYKTYVSKYQGIGLTVAQYESYSERLKDCKGVDADGDGKTDSGSKKAEVVKLIDSLSLTPAQKDQLYYANNYGASGLKDTPWHK